MRSFVFFSQSGCLLTFLIIANLLFGRIFFRTSHWLLLELALIMVFFLNAVIFTRKITSSFRKRDDVIDVEGKVVEDKQKKSG
jgi:predicted membrane protein